MRNDFSTYLKAFSACALLAVSCLFAQFDHRMLVTVPFDFLVSTQHLAAGTYDVTTNLDQGTVLIRGEDNGSAKFAITIATEVGKTQEQAKLVFNRYGERYFLRQVWAPGMDRGRELTASKAEQEFARSFGKPEIVSLLVTAPGMRRTAR
jgi:hypothetical protein